MYTDIPALYVDKPAESVSDKYLFVPTQDILKVLTGEGFHVVATKQSNRSAPTSLHRIDLEHPDFPQFEIGPNDTVRMRAVLFNSYNGRHRFALHVGSFRDVCSNGLVFGSAGHGSMVFRHTGLERPVIEGTYRVIKEAETRIDTLHRMTERRLTAVEQVDFARQAAALRWGEHPPIQPHQLLRARRTADDGDDLWRVFNRVQEHLIQGGNHHTRRLNTRTRPITSVLRDRAINTALFSMAEQLLAA